MNSNSYGDSPLVQRLIDEFSRLPGIGPKTAQRLTYYLIKMPNEQSESLSEAIVSMKRNIVLCRQCFHITDQELCDVCTDPTRDQDTLCVVEQPLDVVAFEKTGTYAGRYHVLHGAISPINGIGPDNLNIRPLIDRISKEDYKEIILATNPNLEGEATSLYIQRLIGDLGVKVTRPARGLPMGGDLEYAEEATLGSALEGRQSI